MGYSAAHLPQSIVAANLFISFLYLVLFLSTINSLRLHAYLRRLSSYFVTCVFAFLSGFFGLRVFGVVSFFHSSNELLILLLGILPGSLYVFLRRESAMFNIINQDSEGRFDKLKDEFLTVASHELRTPLSVINGFAEVLIRCKLGPLNDEQKRRIRKILMQGERLNRIIDELLDMSRIRSGKIEVNSDVFDLVPVLKACLDDYRIVSEQQQVELLDNIPDVLPDVVADLERVTQVIVNLLGNAVKYTPGPGSVTLTAEADVSKQCVKIIITDTGIGINKSDQPHVFDEFYRVTSQTGGKFKGSGLGLSIVKQLVEAQKGTVGVVSEGVGKGTSFYFTLPMSKKAKQGLDLSESDSSRQSVA